MGGKVELFPIPAQQDPANSFPGGLELAKSRQQLRVPVTMAPKLWQCRLNWPQHRVLLATVLGLWNPKCGFVDPKVGVCRPADLVCRLPSLGICGSQGLGLWNFRVMEFQVGGTPDLGWWTPKFGVVDLQIWVGGTADLRLWNTEFGVLGPRIWGYATPELGLWTSRLGFVNPQVWV